jgi:hypothetical protein
MLGWALLFSEEPCTNFASEPTTAPQPARTPPMELHSGRTIRLLTRLFLSRCAALRLPHDLRSDATIFLCCAALGSDQDKKSTSLQRAENHCRRRRARRIHSLTHATPSHRHDPLRQPPLGHRPKLRLDCANRPPLHRECCVLDHVQVRFHHGR